VTDRSESAVSQTSLDNAAPAPSFPAAWSVQLLGALRAARGTEMVIERFETRKIAGLFAYLACHPRRAHPREELIDLFWPEAERDAGRSSLRTALAALRRQIEPADRAGTILITDRQSVRLAPDALATDVAAFETALAGAEHAASPAERIAHLEEAVARYQGDLLPGHYESWVLPERERLAAAHSRALLDLSAALAAAGDLPRAIEHARRAAQADPLDEAARYALIRCLAAAGQTAAARRQYADLERHLRDELDEAPSLPLAAVLAGIDPSPYRPARTPDGRGRGHASVAPSPPHDLPQPLTPFFGREAEIEQIRVLLKTSDARLVTLTGLGGTGKTRLAIEVARRIREERGTAGVAFVPLVDLTDPGRIGDAVRAALGLPATADALEAVAGALAGQRWLLVLDNFEQLVNEGAAVLRSLLERAPGFLCLVTSRVALGLQAEWEYPVAPLPTPAAPATAERLMEFPSVRVFVSRAQAARPGFQLSAENARPVAQLCQALEGIPLALELAAARAQVLTPAQMLQHMSDRFGFLVGRHRDVAARHRTLRAVLEWSDHSLSEAHRRLLGRLSVFRGGWTLAAAEQICGDGPQTVPGGTLEALMDLRDASLLVTEEAAGEMRFRMLETVREYAWERLGQSGEALALRRRHRDYFLALAEETRPRLLGAEQNRWLERLESEHDNLRAALEYCREDAEGGEPGLRLTAALDIFWDQRGYFAEARAQYLAALAHPGAQARTRARAASLCGAGVLCENLSDFHTARAVVEEALAIARELGDEAAAANAMGALGTILRNMGEDEAARRLFEEVLAIHRARGNTGVTAGIVTHLGLLATKAGDLARAGALFEEALSIVRGLGNRWGIAASLIHTGHHRRRLGDLAGARACFEESLGIRREMGNPWGIAAALLGLATVAREEGRDADARPLLEEVATLNRGLGDRVGVLSAVEHLVGLAFMAGEPGTARAFLAEGLSLRRELGEPDAGLPLVEGAALLAAAQRRWTRAACLWGAADARREAVALPQFPRYLDARDAALAATRAALDDAAFAGEWEAGRSAGPGAVWAVAEQESSTGE
jgi:predicted ATPase/DNA-binding SARP family transcriptional activator